MGRMSDLMIEIQEAEAQEKVDAIIRMNNEDIEEGTSDWYEAEELYYKQQYMEELQDEAAYLDLRKIEDDVLENKSLIYKNLLEDIKVIKTLNTLDIEGELSNSEINLKIMLHGYTISILETYLCFRFIEKVTKSEELTNKLLNLKDFSKKCSFAEVHLNRNDIGKYVYKYIHDSIHRISFHNLRKAIALYGAILSVKFDSNKPLYEAVNLRHDCVHRAGRDKTGNRIIITKNNINSVVRLVQEFARNIELHLC